VITYSGDVTMHARFCDAPVYRTVQH
jgi:hypothetical protein